MLSSLLNMPSKIIGILQANISPREIALGVCLAMFLGFIPLNGTTTILLALIFFVFKLNRMATLLTLPLFKAVYLLGVNRLTDGIGSYLLEQANYLTGFWTFLTNLPIIAYLDINRTTVAGGIFLSLVLSIPLYFVVKNIAKPILAAYSVKMQNTAFAKWMRRAYHASSIIGTDADAVMSNVKTTVKVTIVGKIKAAIFKPKGPGKGFLKRINLSKLAFLAILLVVIHISVGLVISPIVSAYIVEGLNNTGSAKITVDRVNVWPLTLSFSMKGLKVFDPKNSDKRIASVGKASFHISPLGLLSKRIIFSDIDLNKMELDLEGAPDGSFNIQRISAAKEKEPLDIKRLWQSVTGKKDWFGKVYSIVKNKFSKEQAKKDRDAAKKVTRVVEELPKGKLVYFKAPKDMYLFEIKRMDINGRVNISPDKGQSVELRDARINLKKVGYDPQNGVKFDGMDIRGELFRSDVAGGRLDLFYSRSYTFSSQTVIFKADLHNVDLDATRFIYEDSLPVQVVRGKVSLSSNTKIAGGSLDSRNSIVLSDHSLKPKSGGASTVGFIPIAAVCNALNGIDPVRLKFVITGTVDRPEFRGFQDILIDLIKPYVANIGEQLKTKGVSALGQLLQTKTGGETAAQPAADSSKTDVTAEKAAESLKSLFSGDE